MPKLPAVCAKQVIDAFSKVGFSVDRIKSSHHIMKKTGHRYALTVPYHGNRTLADGTLRSLIRSAGLTVPEFVELLD